MFGISLMRLGIYVVVVLAVMGILTATYFAWRHQQRMIGWNGAIEWVKQQNAEAKRAADNAISQLDQCDARGGNWNVSTGKCDDATAGTVGGLRFF